MSLAQSIDEALAEDRALVSRLIDGAKRARAYLYEEDTDCEIPAEFLQAEYEKAERHMLDAIEHFENIKKFMDQRRARSGI